MGLLGLLGWSVCASRRLPDQRADDPGADGAQGAQRSRLEPHWKNIHPQHAGLLTQLENQIEST